MTFIDYANVAACVLGWFVIFSLVLSTIEHFWKCWINRK